MRNFEISKFTLLCRGQMGVRGLWKSGEPKSNMEQSEGGHLG